MTLPIHNSVLRCMHMHHVDSPCIFKRRAPTAVFTLHTHAAVEGLHSLTQHPPLVSDVCGTFVAPFDEIIRSLPAESFLVLIFLVVGA